jgi:cytochrome c biogenesis protein
MSVIERAARWLWRALCSRRVAAVLLAALLLASVLASLLPQMPADAAAREPWLEAVALRFGPATGLLHALGLFDAHHAPWYLALLALLLANTLACTLRRVPPLWRALAHPPPRSRPDAFYTRARQAAAWPVASAPEAVAAIQARLARRRYRVWVDWDTAGARANLYAARGRWAPAATLAGHLAAGLLGLALGARPALAWQETGVTLLPGQVHPIGQGTDAAVRAGPLEIELHPSGPLRDVHAALAVIPGDARAGTVVTHTVRINHPLTVGGVAFHLQGYGPAVQVGAPEGVFGLALTGDAPAELALPQARLHLRMAPEPEGDAIYLEARTGDGSLVGSGRVADGHWVEVRGVPLHVRITRYTTWQVSRDPTVWLAVASAGLLAAAAAVSLWSTRRRLWVRVDEGRVQAAGSLAAIEALEAVLGGAEGTPEAGEKRDG